MASIAHKRMKPYNLIRAKLAEYDMDYTKFASRLGISPNTLVRRMTGKFPWSISECYKILELFNLPQDQLHIVFPK